MQEKELFNRIKQGISTRSEQEQFLKWLDKADLNIEEYVAQYFQEGLHQNIIWDEGPVLEKLREQIAEDDHSNVMSIHGKHWSEEVKSFEYSKNRKQQYSFYWKAAMILLFLSALVSIFLIDNQGSQRLSRNLIKTTEYGQKMTFYLPDGSKVVLNSDSRLEFPEVFEADNRTVVLHGEAFFDVVRDVKRPFEVHTGDYVTRVLGTSFVVNDRSDEELEVALRTGKVQVSGKGARGILIPGEKMTIDLRNNSFQKSKFEEIAYFGWAKGVLYFNEVSFREVVDKLEHWYGVKIQVKNMPDLDKKYSGRFENENLENVLQGLSFINGFKFSIKQKNVMIAFK